MVNRQLYFSVGMSSLGVSQIPDRDRDSEIKGQCAKIHRTPEYPKRGPTYRRCEAVGAVYLFFM